MFACIRFAVQGASVIFCRLSKDVKDSYDAVSAVKVQAEVSVGVYVCVCMYVCG